MSLAPTCEAIKHETSGKLFIEELHLLSSWALDKRVRMVCYHQSSIIYLREYGDVVWDSEVVHHV